MVLPASTSFRVLAEEIGLKLALAWESGGHCAASSFCVLADKISVKLAKFSFWLLGAREMYRIRSGARVCLVEAVSCKVVTKQSNNSTSEGA